MAHVHEKIDFTVGVYIVNKGRVFLRKHDKYNIWLYPGGHIELDEDPIQAVIREAKEETGLDIILWKGNQKFDFKDEESEELPPPITINRHLTSPEHEHVNMSYFATSESDVIQPSPDEQQDNWKWCTKEDLETMDLRSDIKFYAALAIDTLG